MILSRCPGGWSHTGVPAPSRAWRLSWIKQLICEIKQKYLLPCEVSREILEYPTWEDCEGTVFWVKSWDDQGPLRRGWISWCDPWGCSEQGRILWVLPVQDIPWFHNSVTCFKAAGLSPVCVHQNPPPPTADSGPTLLRGKTNPTAAGEFYHRDN